MYKVRSSWIWCHESMISYQTCDGKSMDLVIGLCSIIYSSPAVHEYGCRIRGLSTCWVLRGTLRVCRRALNVDF